MPVLRLVTVLIALLATGATAHAATAPGRITFAVDPLAPERTVDAGGATSAVPLPTGGVVLAGSGRADITVAQLTAGGRLDPAFADGGLSRIELPDLRFFPLELLRRPDGRLLYVGSAEARTRFELPQLVVVALTADGELDRTFGEGGIARPGIQGGCGNCAPAALAADGSLVHTGRAGTKPPAGPGDARWVVTRLTPSGSPDAAFGVRTVPGTASGDASGYGASVLPDGRTTLLGNVDRRATVARLQADGTPDPSFNGGAPQAAPVGGYELTVAPSGATTIMGCDGIGRGSPDGRPVAV